MIPTLADQVAAAAATANALRMSSYLRNLAHTLPANRARKMDKDRIALAAVQARPGLTSGELAQISTRVTRSMWSRHLVELAAAGWLIAREPATSTQRNGRRAHRYHITEAGRAVLATLRTAAPETLNPTRNLEH